ncbi:MAG: hypothetical protein HOI43_12995, partial [Gammaproteobacteria bacterium]|nr:hypothetical protein [Gammaproteobacteria bacterium]
GSATKANYEAALESVTYQNSNSTDPDNSNRTVTWLVNDGSSNSSGVTSTITVADVDDAPVLSGAGGTLAYTEDDAATAIDTTLSLTDIDTTNMASATITISSGYQASEDALAFTNANGITGSWNSGSGIMTLSGSATKANYEAALESVTYQNSNSTDPDNSNRTVTWLVNDGTSNSSAVTSTITIADVNDAPVITGAGGGLSYASGDAATAIDTTLTVADADSTNLQSATITISINYLSTEDVLALGNTSLGISASWDSANGVLSLSGSTTVSNYETALESVTYFNSNTVTTSTNDRTITWLVNDGGLNSSAVTSTVSVSGPIFNHYAVSFDGGSTFTDDSGYSCTAVPVTVVAHDSVHNAVGISNTATLSSSDSTGTWVGSGSSTIDLGFSGNTSVTTYLQHAAGTIGINVTDGNVSESASEDPSFTFTSTPVNVVFYKDSNADGTPDGAGSDVPNLTAGTPLNQLLLGVVSNCSQISSVQGQTLAVNLAYECNNPTSCQRNKDMTAGSTSIEENNLGASLTYQTVNLAFNGSGYAPFNLTYNDAGSTKLYSTMTVPASGNNPAIAASGSSNAFVSKPADLVTTVTGNPGTTSSGNGFIAAGTDFSIAIEARNASGGTTPNFGQETSPETAKANLVSLVYPSITNAGVLSSSSYTLSGSTNGAGTITASFSEVGSITLNADIGDGDYLGAGNVTGSTTGTVGRFYPDEFHLSSDSVIDACTANSNHTYMGQNGLNINFTVTAKNTAGATLTHYDAANYAVSSIGPAIEATSNNGVDLSSRLTLASGSWTSGVYSVSTSVANFSRTTSGAPDGPLLLDVGLTITDSLDNRNFDSLNFRPDTSGNCVSSSNCSSRLLVGNPTLRYGRLVINSASGPETQPLAVTLQTEYFNGSGFALNTADSCTSIARSQIEFNGNAITSTGALTVAVGGGNTTAGFGNLQASSVNWIAGDAGLSFSPPGTGVVGSLTVEIDLTNYPWLQYNWNLDNPATYDESPAPATIIFGTFRGHDKVIYWREAFD